MGYVKWLPSDWAQRAAGVAAVRIDTWVMPSHTQAARVADGSLDLAICWVEKVDMDELNLEARLIGADRLYALCTGDDDSPVAAKDVLVLVDSDVGSWLSWNRFGEQFAADTGARVMRTDDGGVTGPTFFEHIRQLGRPVLNNPKGQDAPQPRNLLRRAVVGPTPVWTWSLVYRRGEANPAILALVEAFTRDVGDLGVRDTDVWLPADDPYRDRQQS